ncbi:MULTISPECIES: hypothetical protein [unclassified Burkholderia]|uniref:hypothetical protein n=1 Tax=unclassified Burkholderia TaxID=2613784 RepID=UPI000F584774|nr:MULTISPECIES: hypothetical protein [unclassified Burkholderia]
MTRRLNRNIENGADTTIVHEFVQLIGAAETQVLNAFAGVAPAPALALASNDARCRAGEAGWHTASAGAAGAARTA